MNHDFPAPLVALFCGPAMNPAYFTKVILTLVALTGVSLRGAGAALVVVKISPEGSLILLDGAPMGFTPMNLRVPYGKQVVLRVERSGYKPLEFPFVVPEGQSGRIFDDTLKPLHPGVLIKGVAGARLEVKREGETESVTVGTIGPNGEMRVVGVLGPGRHTFWYSRDGYTAVPIDVILENDATETKVVIAPELKPADAWVQIVALPLPDEVLVEGQSLPMEAGRVAVSAQQKGKLTLRARGYLDRTIDVPEIPPGELHVVSVGPLEENRGQVRLRVVDTAGKPMETSFWGRLEATVDGKPAERRESDVLTRVPVGKATLALVHPHYDLAGAAEVEVERGKESWSDWRASPKASRIELQVRDENGKELSTYEVDWREGPAPLAHHGSVIQVQSGVQSKFVVKATRRMEREVMVEPLENGETRRVQVDLPIDKLAGVREEAKRKHDALRERERSVVQRIETMTMQVKQTLEGGRKLTSSSARAVDSWMAALLQSDRDVITDNPEIERKLDALRTLVHGNVATPGPARVSPF